MHDAEDVIHPLSLRLYSLLIPAHDFVQTPVFSLELGLRQGVAAHLHRRVRRAPPEGHAGARGDRRPGALGRAWAARSPATPSRRSPGPTASSPFNVESLTEDYEIGLKFRLAGKKVHFACRSLEGRARRLRPRADARRSSPPANISRAGSGPRCASARAGSWASPCRPGVRSAGRGRSPVLYCLWRDRKALLTNTLVAAGLPAGPGTGGLRLAASGRGGALLPGLGERAAGQSLPGAAARRQPGGPGSGGRR